MVATGQVREFVDGRIRQTIVRHNALDVKANGNIGMKSGQRRLDLTSIPLTTIMDYA
jgi:hypothetical protein